MSVNSQFQLAVNIIVQIIVPVFKRHCFQTSWHSIRTLRVNATLKNCFFALVLLTYNLAKQMVRTGMSSRNFSVLV
jgi:hypothetical protein